MSSSSSSAEDGWVTDPVALQIVICLDAVGPGDCVRVSSLKHSLGTEVPGPAEGVVTDQRFTDHAVWGGIREELSLSYKVKFSGPVAGVWWVWRRDEVIGWKPRKRTTNS